MDSSMTTLEAASKVLGLSMGTALKLAKSGEIPAVRLGHQFRVRIAELAKLTGEPEETLRNRLKEG